jgi:nitroreductase
MHTITTDQLLSALQWRYATKVFDPARKISTATWAALEEALVLAPSSFGLQPWRFLVIRDPALRARLRPHAWDQAQVTDASHFVVFTARTEITAVDIGHYVERVAEVRGQPVAALAGYRQVMEGSLLAEARKPHLHEWAARQAYIALGQLMTAAAVLGIDACPMEGFEPAKFDEILGIRKDGYATLAAVALGYRVADDKYATLPKVRFPKSEVIKTL